MWQKVAVDDICKRTNAKNKSHENPFSMLLFSIHDISQKVNYYRSPVFASLLLPLSKSISFFANASSTQVVRRIFYTCAVSLLSHRYRIRYIFVVIKRLFVTFLCHPRITTRYYRKICCSKVPVGLVEFELEHMRW